MRSTEEIRAAMEFAETRDAVNIANESDKAEYYMEALAEGVWELYDALHAALAWQSDAHQAAVGTLEHYCAALEGASDE